MKKLQLVYILLLLFTFQSCEKIYTPELDAKERLLVVEGRFIANQQINIIKLYKTLSFYEGTDYPVVSGAKVTLIDDNDNHFPLLENTPGIYQLNYLLDSTRQYKISIELEGELYESTVQSVPEPPVLDTLYGNIETKTHLPDWSNSVDDIVTERGVQTYVDVKNKNKLKYYRFSGRKIAQFIYGTPAFTKYLWETYPLTEPLINIAGPPEYSTTDKITKHKLEFFDDKITYNLPADTAMFVGYIYIIDQFGILKEHYNYYKDLDKQLDSDGKLFDPLYIQPKGNIKCTTNPEIKVLGNFEIESYNEYRYYLFYYSRGQDVFLKKIPYFYDIPAYGSITDTIPDFWESLSKQYPKKAFITH